MKNDLQNQLLLAGLAKKTQTAKKKQPKTKKKAAQKDISQAQSAQAQQLALDKAKNKAIHEAQQRKALNAQVRQIITNNKIDYQKRTTPYYFKKLQTIQRIFVDEKQRIQLALGIIGIVEFESRFILLPRESLDKIRQREGEAFIVVCHNSKSIENYYNQYIDESDYAWPLDYEW